jgi:hypothetical protein
MSNRVSGSVAKLLKHQGVSRMTVDAVDFGDDQIQNQDVTDDGRDVGRLGNAHHQGLDSRQGLMVDEDGMSRLEANTCIVVHIDGNTGYGQVLLG